MSGWWAQARDVGEVVGRQPLLGDALELEQQHVPRLLALHDADLAERRRMPDRQRSEVIDPVGHEARHRPRQRRAPVVTDDVGAVRRRASRGCRHVADDVEDAVALDLGRFRRVAETAQVGCDHAVPGIERAPVPGGATARANRGSRAAAGRRAVAFVLHRKRQITEGDVFMVRSFSQAPTRLSSSARSGPGNGVGSARASARSASQGATARWLPSRATTRSR